MGEIADPYLVWYFPRGELSVMMQVSYLNIQRRSSGTTDIPDVPVTSPFSEERIPEPKIVTRFWIVGIALAVITIVTLALIENTIRNLK